MRHQGGFLRPIRGSRFAYVFTTAMGMLLSSVSLSSSPLELLWERTYDGPSAANDYAYDVAVDSSGNVIAVGSQYVSSQGHCWLVRKYDGLGNLIWSRTFTNTGTSQSAAQGVAVFPGGDIVVAGYVTVGSEGRNWLVEKYDSGGALLWSRTHNGPANYVDIATDVAVGGNGDAVVAGLEMDPVFIPEISRGRCLLRKYDGNGDLLWSRTNNKACSYAAPTDVAMDTSGNVIVSGSFSNGFMMTGWLVEKYDRDGGYLWGKDTGVFIGGATDTASAVVTDYGGNVAVARITGMCQPGPLGGYICWGGTSLLFYDPGGNELWSTSFNNKSEGGYDAGQALAVDRSGNILLAGNRTVGPDGRVNWFFRKHDAAGNLLMDETFAGPAGMGDFAYGVAIDRTGNIVAAGYEQQQSQTVTANWLIRKLREPMPTSAGTPSPELIVYPNPVGGDSFTVEILNLDGDVDKLEVRLFDVAFRLVYKASWRSVTRTAPRVTVEGMRRVAPGIYLLRAKAWMANGSEIKFQVVKVAIKR